MTLWPIFYRNGFCVLYLPNLESQALAKPYWAVNVQDTTKYLPSYKIVIGSKESTVLFEMSTEGQEQVMSIKTFLLQINDEKEKLYTYVRICCSTIEYSAPCDFSLLACRLIQVTMKSGCWDTKCMCLIISEAQICEDTTAYWKLQNWNLHERRGYFHMGMQK